jgi:hypothetical protein
MLKLCSSSAQACSGSAQACSGSAPACSPSAQVGSPSAQVGSPSAQVKAAVAHVCRLIRNQRKGKLILSLWVFSDTITLPQRLTDAPVFGNKVAHIEVTDGRPGGLNAGEQL